MSRKYILILLISFTKYIYAQDKISPKNDIWANEVNIVRPPKLNDWQIKGALSALKDTSQIVVNQSFLTLFSRSRLDSIVANSFSTKEIEYCRDVKTDSTETDEIESDELRLFVLGCQKSIPNVDLLLIQNFLKNNRTNLIELYNQKNIIKPELLRLYRSIWNIVGGDTKQQICEALSLQNPIPKSDLDLIGSFINTPYSQKKATEKEDVFQKEFGGDLPDSKKHFEKSRTELIYSLIAKSPISNEVIDFLNNLSKDSSKSKQEYLLNALLHSKNLDKELLPICKQLVIKFYPNDQFYYLQSLAHSRSLESFNLKEIKDYLDSSQNCKAKIFILKGLILNPKMRGIAISLLSNEMRKLDCLNWIYLIDRLDDSTLNDSIINENIRNLKPDNDFRSSAIVKFLSRKKRLSIDDRKLLIDIIENKDRPDQQKLISLSRISSESAKLFCKLLTQVNDSKAEYMLDALTSQNDLDNESLNLLKKAFDSKNSRIKYRIINIFAYQKSMQPEVVTFFKNILDTSHEYAEDIAQALLRREEIPEGLWPLLMHFHEDDLSIEALLMRENSYSGIDPKIPEKYCYKLINSLYDLDKSFWTKEDILVYKFRLYYFGGGSRFINFVLNWLPTFSNNIPDIDKINFKEKKAILRLFDSVWSNLDGCNKLKEEIAGHVNSIILSMTEVQINSIGELALNFQERFQKEKELSRYGAELKDKLQNVLSLSAKISNFILSYWYLLLIHPILWALLIFIYPKSNKVQSLFFWNENVRLWGGLGYVNLLLINLSFFRNRLMYPFKYNLIADAHLEEFNGNLYFRDFPLRVSDSTVALSIDEARSIKTQILIKGESGLGKTMILRCFLAERKRLSVFINADQCNDDVVTAIKGKTMGIAQDDNFIKSILFNGALDVYIDGINEVGPETRVKISDFIKQFTKCKCFIATQPIDWGIPSNVCVIEILPLEKEYINSFLYSRYETYLPQNLIPQKKEYEQLCDKFLDDNIGDSILPEQRKLNQKLLSNPLDLTIVGQLLINLPDKALNILSLQKEYYDQMSISYKETYPFKSEGFPLFNFSEKIYSLHIADNHKLPYEEYHSEIDCMQKFKMVVSRISKKEDSEKEKEEWFFRHDKIKDFFLLQTFLIHKERQKLHIADSRFRGVYFLLATYLSLDDAKLLERILINYSVDNNDHLLSSEFIKLLRNRGEAENI